MFPLWERSVEVRPGEVLPLGAEVDDGITLKGRFALPEPAVRFDRWTINATFLPEEQGASPVSATRPISRDGSFSVPGLLPGRYLLTVYLGHSHSRGREREVAAERTVELREDTSIEIAAEPVASGVIHLQVRDEKGIPLDAFTSVTATRQPAGIAYKQEPGEKGRFELALRPGRYDLRITASGCVPKEFPGVTLEPGEAKSLSAALTRYVDETSDLRFLHRALPRDRHVRLNDPVTLGAFLEILDRIVPGLLVVTPGVQESGVLETQMVRELGWTPTATLRSALQTAGLRCRAQGERIWILPPGQN
jgi:hypothetical protein